MASSDTFEQLLAVTRLTQQFRGVERRILYPNSDQPENDAEHSFQLAILAWYILEREELSLDRDAVFRYALAHDLVEIYAGDAFFTTQIEENEKTKRKKEDQARKRLKREFPEWRTLHECIAAYEERKTPEARFIYALDKVVPIMNIYLDNGRSWKTQDISLEQLVTLKQDKVEQSDVVSKYFDALVERLRAEEPTLFSNGVDET